MSEFDDDNLPGDREDERPPPRSKLSKTPSWIMVGFLLGVLFVWSLPRSRRTPPPPPEPAPKAAPATAPTVARLMEIEAVFAEWGRFAVWENDTTQVALWNASTNAYSDFFEVLRTNDTYFFRTIPRLTRPILTHGVSASWPLQFTETEASHRQWLNDVAKENWRAISEAARQTFGGARPKEEPKAPVDVQPGSAQATPDAIPPPKKPDDQP